MFGIEGYFSFWFLVIGIFAGWLAGRLTRGHGFGILGDLVMGVIGAFIGAYLFNALGLHAYGTLGAIIMATIGAIVLSVLLRIIF